MNGVTPPFKKNICAHRCMIQFLEKIDELVISNSFNHFFERGYLFPNVSWNSAVDINGKMNAFLYVYVSIHLSNFLKKLRFDFLKIMSRIGDVKSLFNYKKRFVFIMPSGMPDFKSKTFLSKNLNELYWTDLLGMNTMFFNHDLVAGQYYSYEIKQVRKNYK